MTRRSLPPLPRWARTYLPWVIPLLAGILLLGFLNRDTDSSVPLDPGSTGPGGGCGVVTLRGGPVDARAPAGRARRLVG